MIISIDTEAGEVIVRDSAAERRHAMGSADGFAAISHAWLLASWDAKYVYSFMWFGRPIIQLPEDLIRIQEVIYRIKPDVIVETGVAHGGSLMFYATLLKAIGTGRVIGIDVEIRPANRLAIEAHELKPLITLVEGSSVEPDTVARVKSLIGPREKVLVLLDSNHTKDHVLLELHNYAPLVSVGSYIVATDGFMEQVVGRPRSQPDWSWNNPHQAALAFVKENPSFQLEELEFEFNESMVRERITYWPSSFLRRAR